MTTTLTPDAMPEMPEVTTMIPTPDTEPAAAAPVTVRSAAA